MAEIQNISIELVKVHPNNVRKTYNDIEELAESIKAKGILQNLTVVPDPRDLKLFPALFRIWTKKSRHL